MQAMRCATLRTFIALLFLITVLSSRTDNHATTSGCSTTAGSSSCSGTANSISGDRHSTGKQQLAGVQKSKPRTERISSNSTDKHQLAGGHGSKTNAQSSSSSSSGTTSSLAGNVRSTDKHHLAKDHGGKRTNNRSSSSSSNNNTLCKATSPFQPNLPHALPHVAIIGTAKAGTTDLYSLIIKTSQQAPGSNKKRQKEAKLLVEDGRVLKPGHADFQQYLQRIGHPCALAADPRVWPSPAKHTDAAGDSGNTTPFSSCMANLANQAASKGLSANSKSNSNSNSNNSSNSSSSGGGSECQHQQQVLTVDATPMYLGSPKAAASLRALSRNTKIIVLLRDPVDRAESLYNHRSHTEADGHLPKRVGNLTLDQWSERFLAWVDSTPGTKQLLDQLSHTADLDQQAQLYKQLVSANILGLPDGPLTFATYNRQGHIARNIFGTCLYGSALATWRAVYSFQPGRVMIIDAHHFFRHRLQVLDEVFVFIHGRPLSAAETRIAQRTAIQNARRRAGIHFAGAKLGGRALQRMREFYWPHKGLLVGKVLPALQAEGARVVGFTQAPWVQVQQHH